MGKAVFVLLVVTYLIYDSNGDKDIVGELSKKFAHAFEECKTELSLPDSINADFVNFWKDDYPLTNRFTGCAIMCLSAKLNLHDNDGKLHHANAQDFAMKHGASEELAKKLVNLLHECQVNTPQGDDPCITVLEISKCFKAEIHKMNWAPPGGLGEMIAEI